MIEYVCSNGTPTITGLVIFYIADKLTEYWLGKTERTKSGSILELLLNLIKLPFKKNKEG